MQRERRIALIDADIYIYQAAVGAEVATDWGDGLWTLHADANDAEANLHAEIKRLVEVVEADEAILALSDTENFRKQILPTYKSNRKGTRKPMLVPFLRDSVWKNWKTYQKDGLEGDDVLGILATWPGLKGTKVIVTGDKDLYTIPGLVYMSHKPELGITEVSHEQARYTHMMQTLTGDTTDGYTGCPGIGPVRAKRILDAAKGTPKDYWSAVVNTYQKAGLSEEEALVQARVAYILRAEHFNTETKEPILWNP